MSDEGVGVFQAEHYEVKVRWEYLTDVSLREGHPRVGVNLFFSFPTLDELFQDPIVCGMLSLDARSVSSVHAVYPPKGQTAAELKEQIEKGWTAWRKRGQDG